MLYFITGNPGKFREVKAIIPAIEQINLDLDEIQTLDPKKLIAHKLAQAAKAVEGDIIVDDTSLRIEGLGGLPGTLIKWFEQALGIPGLAKTAIASGNPRASSHVTIGYRSASGDIHYFEAEYSGEIVEPNGTGGFGWDAIFKADGQATTNAHLTIDQKNALSARGKAARLLAAHLKSAASG